MTLLISDRVKSKSQMFYPPTAYLHPTPTPPQDSTWYLSLYHAASCKRKSYWTLGETTALKYYNFTIKNIMFQL